MKKLLLLLVCAAFCTSAQITLTLQCSKDAAIGYHDGHNTAGNNYGTATQNAAYLIPAAGSGGYNGNRALIDFNLASIPANATILSAKLNLHAIGPFGSLPGHFGANRSYLQRITQSWGEMTATWSNQPPVAGQGQVQLANSTSATQDYLNIDVTALVGDMIANPTMSYGFMLRLENEVSGNGLCFASKDHANAALRPTLIIQYTPCTPAITISASASPTALCTGGTSALTASGASSYTWTNSQNQVVGHTYSVAVTSPNVYTVTGTNSEGCRGEAVVIVYYANCIDTGTGIDEADTDKTRISIYPNPAAGVFKISSDIYFNKIALRDMQGRLIKVCELPAPQNTYFVEPVGVAPGLYFCTVMHGSKVLMVKKLVIAGK